MQALVCILHRLAQRCTCERRGIEVASFKEWAQAVNVSVRDLSDVLVRGVKSSKVSLVDHGQRH